MFVKARCLELHQTRLKLEHTGLDWERTRHDVDLKENFM